MLPYTNLDELLVLPFVQDYIDSEIIDQLLDEKESAVFKQKSIATIAELIVKYSIHSDSMVTIPSEITDLYILYIYSLLLQASIDHILANKKIQKLNISRDLLFSKYYFPNILFALSTKLKKANSFFKKILRKIYNDAINNQDKNLLFYTSFYKFDFNLLSNDILSIFLNNIIFEVNPYNLEDYKHYYMSTFGYIFGLYLYNKSSNVIDFDVEPFLKQDNCLSTRYNIYKDSIRLTQIQGMCRDSSSLTKIYENFNKIKSNILSNELQRMYSTLINNDTSFSNKSLILQFNSDDNDILRIKRKYPMIYSLLRSIKIESTTDKSIIIEKNLIRQLLRDKLFIKFKTHLNEIQASILADTISIKIEQDLTNGIYLDPFTLSVIEISGNTFVKQLVDFVGMILDSNLDSKND